MAVAAAVLAAGLAGATTFWVGAVAGATLTIGAGPVAVREVALTVEDVGWTPVGALAVAPVAGAAAAADVA